MRILPILLLLTVLTFTTSCGYLYERLAWYQVEQAQAVGDYEEMLRISLPLARTPGKAQVNFLGFMGRAYRGLGRHEAGKAVVAKGLSLTNDVRMRSIFYNQLAEIYAVQDSFELARTYARLSVEADPNDIIMWNNWGHVCIQVEDYEEAVRIYTTALQRFPPHPYVLNNRAEAYINLDHFDAALADLRASHELDPRNPYVYKNKALYYQRLDQPALMCENARRAAQLFDGVLGYTYDWQAMKALFEQCNLDEKKYF